MRIKFVTKGDQPQRSYSMGMAFYNVMSIQNELGYLPTLLESNPLKLTEMYEYNIIVNFGVYQNLISVKPTFHDQLKQAAGLQKPAFLRFLEIPNMIIQHNVNN